MYHPVPASRRWLEPSPNCEFRDIALLTAQGVKIHARWFSCHGTQQAVLVCHSRAGNLSLELAPADVAKWHRELRSSVLIFDYPGYGRSSGTPSETGCYAAAHAAYERLSQNQGVPPRHVLIYGRSLGSAVAVELASRRPHRALVLVSPLTSLPDVALSYFPLLPARVLMRNRFNSLERIGHCAAPIFFVHGTRDRLVPFTHGKALFDAADGAKELLVVDGAGHADCLTPAFFPALRRFLTRAETLRSLSQLALNDDQ